MRRAMLPFALLTGLACGGDSSGPSGPTPGQLTIQLNTSSTNVGALMFLIRGGPVDSVSSSYSSYDAEAAGGNHRTIVTGNIAAGPVAIIHVPDTREAGSYSATVEQAATRQTYGLQSATGFTMTVVGQ